MYERKNAYRFQVVQGNFPASGQRGAGAGGFNKRDFSPVSRAMSRCGDRRGCLHHNVVRLYFRKNSSRFRYTTGERISRGSKTGAQSGGVTLKFHAP